MNNFSKAVGLAKRVKVQIHDEMPLLVEFELEKDLGILRYYLAPKGEEESEE